MRSDVREGLNGTDLRLRINVVDVADGTPLPGLKIDMWHADANGRYSGYDFDPDEQPVDVAFQPPTLEETFLRGAQVTDERGRVEFLTVFPGWYAARTPHIHVKVFRGDACVLTTQLFFSGKDSDRVFDAEAYRRRRAQDTRNHADPVIAIAKEPVDGCWVELAETAGGLLGKSVLALDPDALSDPRDAPKGYSPPLGGVIHGKPVR